MNRKAFFFLLLAGLFLTACGNPPAESQNADVATAEAEVAESAEVASAWDQHMDAFHDVMSGTFHPAEEGDLAPLKERYQELAQQAKVWTSVPIPDKHQGKDLPALMQQLETGSADLAILIKQGASDEELKNGIYALHDVYHGIVGACQDEH